MAASDDGIKDKMVSYENIKQSQMMSDENVKNSQTMSDRNVKLRYLVPRTICHGLVILTLGMTVSMRGPSFIDLQVISGTDVETGSFYFTASAFCYIIGVLFTGAIYSRVKIKNMLIIVPMTVSAIMFAATPWCAQFVAMLLIHGGVAFFWGLYETTVYTEEVKGWEGNSYSAMQFLSFTYSLGGIIGPFLLEPFLAPRISDVASNLSSSHHSTTQNVSGTTVVSHYLSQETNSLVNTTVVLQQSHWNRSMENTYNVDILMLEDDSLYNSSLKTNLSHTLPLHSNIHYAYLIAGVIIILCSIPLCVLYFWTRKTLQKQTQENAPQETRQRKLSKKMYVLLTGTISIFYFFYTMVDDSYTMYLSTFVVSHLDWSKEDGAIVSSLYWGCSTATKLLMIILMRQVNPSIVLFFSCLGMVIFMALLTVSAHFHVHWIIWVCAAFMAVSQSPVSGGVFAWADANLLKFDGRVTSCAMVFASLGAMLDPMLLGVTMKEISLMAFPYLLTFQAFITFSIYLAMLVVLRPYVSRKYGRPRAEGLEIDLVEESSSLCQEMVKENNCNGHTSLS